MRVQDLANDQFEADQGAQAEPRRRSVTRTPDDQKVTGLTEQQIDEIDALFPERAPDPTDSEREVWMKAGERRLVRTVSCNPLYTFTPETPWTTPDHCLP